MLRGTERLTAVDPWLPARRGHIELAIGPTLLPGDKGRTPRERDYQMCLRLGNALREQDALLPTSLRKGWQHRAPARIVACESGSAGSDSLRVGWRMAARASGRKVRTPQDSMPRRMRGGARGNPGVTESVTENIPP